MSRKLLIETHTVNISPTQLNENVSKENGNIVVEGILATAEVKNGNGRYYSRQLWERELDKYSELIKERRAFCCKLKKCISRCNRLQLGRR